MKGTKYHEIALLVTAAINVISSRFDGDRPEQYVAGAVFFVGYCVLFAMRSARATASVGGAG